MEQMPDEKLVTAEELYTLPEDHLRHELVAGVLLSEPPAGWNHGTVAGRAFEALRNFAGPKRLGVVVSADTGFVLARSPDTVRAPDVAFVSSERARQAGEIPVFFPGAPDLAVEVRSPGDTADEVHGKVADYLAAGTRLVWVVEPAIRRVTVYRTLLAPRFLEANDPLEGEDVLPGFSVPVENLFED